MAVDTNFVNNLAQRFADLGSVKAVGETWCSIHGIIPKGGLPYCGQEVSRTTYAALWQWVNDNGLVISESNWQSLNTSQNGNVPKYSSGNGSTTFRMPKIIGYFKSTDSLGGAGAYQSEGLPDHNHTVSVQTNSGWNGNVYQGGSDQNRVDKTFAYTTSNASVSNAIYGRSAHVTPETITVIFGVYAFGEVTNVGSIDLQSIGNLVNQINADYLQRTGGTKAYRRAGISQQWRDILNANLADNSSFYQTSYTGYMPALNLQTSNGRVGFGTYTDECAWTYFLNTNTTNGADCQVSLKAFGLTCTKSITGSTVQATSDKRLKSEITDYSADLSSLNTYRYTLNADGKKHVGLIAQEVKEIIPEAVSTDKDGYYSLDYNAIVAVLVGKVNELEARLKKLEG